MEEEKRPLAIDYAAGKKKKSDYTRGSGKTHDTLASSRVEKLFKEVTGGGGQEEERKRIGGIERLSVWSEGKCSAQSREEVSRSARDVAGAVGCPGGPPSTGRFNCTKLQPHGGQVECPEKKGKRRIAGERESEQRPVIVFAYYPPTQFYGGKLSCSLSLSLARLRSLALDLFLLAPTQTESSVFVSRVMCLD